MKIRIPGFYNFQPKHTGSFQDSSYGENFKQYVVEFENKKDFPFHDNKGKVFYLKLQTLGYSILIEETDPTYSNFLKRREYINLPSTNFNIHPRELIKIIKDSNKLESFAHKVLMFYTDTENTRAYLETMPMEKVEKFLIDNADWVEWSAVHSNKYLEGLTLKTLQDFSDQFDWLYIVSHLKLSYLALNKIKNFVNIKFLLYWQKLPESFIEEHMNNIEFIDILSFQSLSESFIRKYLYIIEKEKRYWEIISERAKLSHQFLVDFQNELSWDKISKSQELSKESLLMFWDKFDFELLKTNYSISFELIKKFEIDSDRKRTREELLSKNIFGWIKKKVKDIIHFIKEKNKKLKIYYPNHYGN